MAAMNYDRTIDAGRARVSADPGLTDEIAQIAEEAREDRAPRSKRRRVIIGALIALGVLIAAALLFSRGGEDLPPVDTVAQVPTVTVLTPGRASFEGAINVTGTLAARRPLPVGSVGEGGRVERVLVDAGDWVRQGQVLAVIDRSVQAQQAEAQAAQVAVAHADAELAQANLDRALRLVDRGFISQADVDRLTATRDAAAARVRVAEAQLDELQARNSRLNITAPAGGLVLERNVEPGQVVSGGSGVLFRIAQGGEMELLATVSESDLAQLSVGGNAEVTPVGVNRSFAGRIWQLSPTIDPETRQGIARIALPYARELRPGGFAGARILSGVSNAPILPESAILSDDEGSYVLIVGTDNRVARRPVTTGAVTADGIVVAEGLNGTEKVVLRAGGFLSPGDLVKPRLAKPGS